MQQDGVMSNQPISQSGIDSSSKPPILNSRKPSKGGVKGALTSRQGMKRNLMPVMNPHMKRSSGTGQSAAYFIQAYGNKSRVQHPHHAMPSSLTQQAFASSEEFYN
jgi:hypothetical protein